MPKYTSCLMNHSLNYYHYCLLFHISELMSTTSPLLLLDDERKAQLDLLNKIDKSGEHKFVFTIQS